MGAIKKLILELLTDMRKRQVRQMLIWNAHINLAGRHLERFHKRQAISSALQ